MSVQPTNQNLPIYVYAQSPAVNTFCADQVFSTLNRLGVQPHRIIKAPDISYLNKSLSAERAILVFPGGQTMWLGQELDLCKTDGFESLAKKIQSKIASGWNCWGACSGGNILCQKLTYRHPELGLMDSTRDCKLWQLIPVNAHTPCFEYEMKYKDPPGKLVPITLPGDEGEFICYWNAGSKFESLSDAVTVEANFKDLSSPAVVSAQYGKGKIVGTAIHPEIDVGSVIDYYSKRYDASNADLTALKSKTQSAADSAEARDVFLTQLLKKVEILPN